MKADKLNPAPVQRQSATLAWEVLFLLASLALTLPLWVTRYLPLQDYPQHVAAVRIIHDFDTARFAFHDYFELDWARTQYISVYLAAHLLSYLFGVLLACKLLLAAILVALPYSLRSVLRAHERPEAYALLALPLSYNAHFILGFLNFIAAIPLFFWGVSAAVRYRQTPSGSGALKLSVLAFVLFYTHVVPFALLVAAVVSLSLGRSLRSMVRALLPLLPASCALLFWLFKSPAGQVLRGAASGPGQRGAQFLSIRENWRELPMWLLDVLPGTHLRTLALVWVSVVLLACAFAFAFAFRNRSGATRDPVLARWSWLLPAIGVAYFVLPAAYDWIWPINGRFPILALLLAIVFVPRLPRLPRVGLALSALAMEGVVVFLMTHAFASADKELEGLHSIIEKIPEGERVAGLMYARGSASVKFSPALHAVAWYQAEKGGAVMFSFVEFPHSPVSFLEGNRPPRVQPRWEYIPERVDPASDLAWYRYVISRGGPPELKGLSWVAEDGSWRLWSKTP